MLVSVDLPGRRDAFEPLTAAELLAQERFRITLYTPREELPAVAPSKQPVERAGAKRARERFRQKIVANDPDPQSLRQKILGPAPEIEIEHDIPSPNLLAWNAPNVSRPRFQMAKRQENTPRRKALSTAPAPKMEPVPAAVPDLPAAQLRLRFRREKEAEATPARQALAPDKAPELQSAAAKVDLDALDTPNRMRYWTPEAGPRTVLERQIIEGDAAPEIGAGREAIDLGAIQKNPRLRYWNSGTNRVAPGRRAVSLGDAPAIEAKASGVSQVGTLSGRPRLRYRSFGDKPAAPKQGVLTPGTAAPRIKGMDGLGGSGTATSVAALRVSKALADAVKAGYDAGESEPGATEPGAAPMGGPVAGPGNAGPNALIIGLDPDPNAVGAIPIGSRRGRFSASPDGGPGGGDLMIASTGGAALRAHNLSIDGDLVAEPGVVVQSDPRKKPALLRSGIVPRPSRANDASALALFQRQRDIRDMGAPPVIDPDIDIRSKSPDLLFLDREVFVLAVNTPNVTSYSGSWVIRFAERFQGMKRRDKTIDSDEEEDPSLGLLSAPGPKHKVDPKYIRTAVDEGVEGTVTLYAVIQMDGSVRDIEVVKGIDSRLDESAMAALGQWQFHPATRLGVPVEVDVLIDIPFRLAPPEAREKRVIQRF